MTKQLLIVFAKNLVRGKVKTRLAMKMGDDKAFDIYKALLAHTLAVTSPLAVSRVIYYSNFIPANDEWANAGFKQKPQDGDDLGIRMMHAFREAFAAGYEQVVLIGTDCYQLTSDILLKAFESLASVDAVVGPAKDGGYYLLGLKKPYPELFTNKSWSTPLVREETLDTLKSLDLSYALLPELQDIDTEQDYWETMNPTGLELE